MLQGQLSLFLSFDKIEQAQSERTKWKEAKFQKAQVPQIKKLHNEETKKMRKPIRRLRTHLREKEKTRRKYGEADSHST